MAYDFSRFTSQSFECFAQALVSKQFGPGVQIYGDGPDGAREASFEGPLGITTHETHWNGYVVVQAKHRRTPKGGADDASWLEHELAGEFSKYLDPDRSLRKPEFYLIITNVSLTPASSRISKNGRRIGAGGQERIESFIRARQHELGLRGWLVWHADLLTAMLDTEPELRTRYSAWVTEGDVLSAALVHLARPSMTDVVPLSIKRELKRDRDVKRKDAGQVTEKRIFVDDVFVDLPISTQDSFFEFDEIDADSNFEVEIEPANDLTQDDNESVVDFEEYEEGDPDEANQQLGIVALLLRRAGDKLDPKSLADTCPPKRPKPNRIVLMGGPGQGKSTISQFLVQIFRSTAVLCDHHKLPADETREVAEAILKRSDSEGLPTNNVRRFPLHIDLAKFADAAAREVEGEKRLSLLRFATQQLAKGTDYSLDPSDLRAWLGLYPWLLVLDGLDEVPPTGNRAEVINAINDFWDDVHEVNADILVLVTTRPQGYGDDLSRRLWEHWPMANLKPTDAMRFAERLADVLLSDGSRRDEILGELRRASEDPATAPIMISPLQVSILFSLVETRGGVPADRWSLFQRHYTLLRDREAAKEGPTARLLRDYATQIDQIHYDAGYLLHVRAEDSGSADSYLIEAEFENLVVAQLESEGYNSEKIREISRRISLIATQRLVLLGSKIGGRIAFDVRSLQEFMAAARIMSSPEVKIIERITEIAARTHWRHVFRIAASKAFALAELTHLRQQIIHVCDALDQGDIDAADRVARSGANLALDLLGDNVAARLPELRRSLVTRALKLLDLGPKAVTEQLSAFLDSDTKQSYDAELTPRLAQGETQPAKGAWKLLVIISNINPIYRDWADGHLKQFWPKDHKTARRLFVASEIMPESEEALNRIRDSLFAGGPKITRSWLSRAPFLRAEALPKRLQDIGHLSNDRRDDISLQYFGAPEKRGRHKIYVAPLTRPNFLIPHAIEKAADWIEVNVAHKFLKEPNAKNLSQAIQELSKANLSHFDLDEYPWPLASVLAQVNRAADLPSLADRALLGSFGDFAEWKAAEARWLKNGIRFQDIKPWGVIQFISSTIATEGAPYPSRMLISSVGSPINSDVADEFAGVLVALLDALPNGMRKRKFSGYLFRFAREASPTTKRQVLHWALRERKQIDQHGLSASYLISFIFSLPEILMDDEAFGILNELGSNGSTLPNRLLHTPNGVQQTVAQIIEKKPQYRGLLSFLHPSSTYGIPKRTQIALNNLPLRELEGDSSVTRAEIAFFRIMSGAAIQATEFGTLASTMLLGFSANRLIQSINSIVNSRAVQSSVQLGVIRELCERASDRNVDYYGDISVVLKRLLDRRHSNLAKIEAAARLELPSLAKLMLSSA